MTEINIHISIINLKINDINSPLKTQRLPELMKKQNPYICCLQETQFSLKDGHRLRVKDKKKKKRKTLQENGSRKQTGVIIPIFAKIGTK